MPKLVYFDIYALAEPIRMTLHHIKKDFEDVRISFEDLGKFQAEGKYLTGLPVFVSDEGHEYT